jgi:hypothetical protein
LVPIDVNVSSIQFAIPSIKTREAAESGESIKLPAARGALEEATAALR